MATLTILFWNIQQKDLSVNIARMMKAHSIDLVILAEIPDIDVRLQLSSLADRPVYHANNPGVLAGKTHVYSIHPVEDHIRHKGGELFGRLNVFEVALPHFPRFVMSTVHLVSKVNFGPESQTEEAGEIVRQIHANCTEMKLNSLLVCGDFNLDPFDQGMRGPRYFHAVMDRSLARRRTRTIQGRNYAMLYNPMWSLFGDHPEGPPGTYFHRSSTHETTYWHMLDQFLLSSELLEIADVSDISILAGDGDVSFLTSSGRPRRGGVYSDHLPILLRLTEKT